MTLLKSPAGMSENRGEGQVIRGGQKSCVCWHNFTQSAYFMIFFVSSISYRPTDLSLFKEFSKNVSFSNSYNQPSESAVQKLSMSTVKQTISRIGGFKSCK